MAQDRDMEEMLAYLKINSVDELFDDIPETARSELTGLKNGITEQEVRNNLENILNKNTSLKEMPSFLGGGAYDYYVPAAVNNIVGRSEFITSYTPYQPEISQGLLQALFEYQSMMSELTGMEVVNNSLYDYTTGLGEAVLMAARLQRKAKIFLIPDNLPMSRISVLENYCNGPGIKFQKYAIDKNTGMTDLEDLKSKIDDNTIGALVETPNYYGVLETNVDKIRQILDGKIMVVGADAVSLGIVRPPGDYGADIVISEGQVFGNAVNFGGPLLGIMACRKKHIRKMPGRVIGLTSDTEGNRAFCMTLQTREQHIRREKATSNICSNEALTTVATAAYMAYMGGSGLRELAIKVMQTSRELANQIAQVPGCQAPKFTGHHFNEFVASFPMNAQELIQKMNEKDINPGIGLEIPGMENDLLIAVTDKTSPENIQEFIQALKEAVK